MSHFSVMVIHDKELNDETLAPILQPWHEYECTGIVDQYVVEEDITDEVLEIFNRDQKVVVLADGSMISRYDDRCYVITDDRCKTWKLPEGAVEKTVSADEARQIGIGYKTMDECAEDHFGIEEGARDGRYYQKTNPNKKWDWWQVGGRWSGMLKPEYDPSTDPENIDEDGKPKWPTNWRNIGNIAQLKDIPLDALRDEAGAKALEQFNKAQEIIAGRPIVLWKDTLDKFGTERIDEAREEYRKDQVHLDLQKANLVSFFNGDNDLIAYSGSVDDYVAAARARVLQTYAIVKDGCWYQKGEMGWFGMSSDEMSESEWQKKVAEMLDGLSPETWIAIVDCHI
jgi:hypothetical protein